MALLQGKCLSATYLRDAGGRRFGVIDRISTSSALGIRDRPVADPQGLF